MTEENYWKEKYADVHLRLTNRIAELEQENKELKEKIDKYYQQTLDDEILMNELSLEVDLRKKESDFYLEKLSKYRFALEKIRIYINRCRDSHCDSNCEYWDNCKGNYNIDNILDKINEVLQCE